MMKLIIPGTVPSQKNGKSVGVNPRTHRVFVTSNPRVKAWQTEVLWGLKNTKLVEWKYPVSVTMAFAFDDRRRHDLDNCASTVLDVLVKAKILEDDSYAYVCPLTLDFIGIEKGDARVEVFIDEY